jgi:N4-bis(aminopropyl)spermidine synthase
VNPGEELDAAAEVVAEVVAGFGIAGRRVREAIALLTGGPRSLDDLIRECALPRRTVEALLRAAEPDLDRDGGGVVIRADRLDAYRKRFATADLLASRPADPVAARPDLVAAARADIEAAPAAKAALDHVPATAETVVRRALWLAGTFDLAGARLLCVGDHDLTSLAVAGLVPDLAVTVVDLDERLLEFVEDRAATRGLDIRCLYADFRFGIPDSVAESADLVLTDPPYTPEGVQLFLGRGVQGLRDRTNGRLVMAYGFSPAHPALGMKVQHAIGELELVTEAILPAFNRYHGAQAVGSASDLYVCRPTARTRQVLERRLARAAPRIYTHGAQSLEGSANTLDPEVAAAVTDLAGEESAVLVGPRWPKPAGATTVELSRLLTTGLPATRRAPGFVAVDLVDDPGPWLLRTLLAVNAERVAVLVPNNHPDLANAAAQHALTDLLAAKYSLRLRRSTPTPAHAVVEATAVDPGQSPVVHHLLTRAHGRTGNVVREALVRHAGNGLTKNEARAAVAEAVSRPAWLEARLIDLPRHALRTLCRLPGILSVGCPG